MLILSYTFGKGRSSRGRNLAMEVKDQIVFNYRAVFLLQNSGFLPCSEKKKSL